ATPYCQDPKPRLERQDAWRFGPGLRQLKHRRLRNFRQPRPPGLRRTAMKFVCDIEKIGTRWTVRHKSAGVGEASVSGASKEEALEKMRNELRYRLELCPCT